MRTTFLIPAALLAAVAFAAFAQAGAADSAIDAASGGIESGAAALGRGAGAEGTRILATTGGAAVGEIAADKADEVITPAGNAPPPPALYSGPAQQPDFIYQQAAPNYVAPPSPPPTYIDQNAGTFCREISRRVMVNGVRHENYGTACLQPDGSWRIVR